MDIRCSRLLLCSSLLLVCMARAQSQSAPVQLAANERLAEQWVAAQLLQEVYRQAGLNLVIEPMPPARATKDTLSGAKDGEVARIRAYGENNPTLIRVEPAIYALTSNAFSLRSRSAEIKRRDDLVHYSLGAIRGVAHSNELTEGHPATTLTQRADLLFKMLVSRRFDAALDTGINGRYLIKRQGLADIQVSPDLAQHALYHYLSPKNPEMAIRIGKVITQMRASGEMDKLIAKAEAGLQKIDLETFTGTIK